MGRINKLAVRNYRSFSDWQDLRFPPGKPVVILGENNAGKSNLTTALDLVLGERWPGNHRPEDHEFYDRSPDNVPMQVLIDVEDVRHVGRYEAKDVAQLSWKFPDDDGRDPVFSMGFSDRTSSPYVSNATRDQCFCLLIAADRQLNYQLSYRSKWTFLSKLMRRFHNALVGDIEREQQLKEHFESIKSIFRQVPEFQAFSDSVASHVADLSGNFEYQLEVDFSAYDPSNYFQSLRVFPSQDGSVRSFDELGTGQEQVLAIAFAWAYAQAFHGSGDGMVLIIEEPESHLHPLAQRWLSRRLHEFAADGLQVVITTHSPAFLDVRNLEGLVRVSKPDGASKITQHSVESFVEHCVATGATGANADTTLQRYTAWATEEILSGLFARRCVLVEGPTEATAIPKYLARVGYDAEREGTAFIPVGGVGDLAKWWRFFTAYEIPCYACFDRDEGEDRDGRKRSDLMVAAGMQPHQTAEILASREILEHPRLCMFVEDFETAMVSLFGQTYAELQDQAREEHGLSGNQAKPLIARYIAEEIEMTPATTAFFERMAERLRETRHAAQSPT